MIRMILNGGLFYREVRLLSARIGEMEPQSKDHFDLKPP